MDYECLLTRDAVTSLHVGTCSRALQPNIYIIGRKERPTPTLSPVLCREKKHECLARAFFCCSSAVRYKKKVHEVGEDVVYGSNDAIY